MKKLLRLTSIAAVSVLILASCEGPMGMQGNTGPDGPIGPQGPDGRDATCNRCHTPASVDAVFDDYHFFSAHAQGTSFAQGSRADCAPCHTPKGFLYVVENNTPASFNGSTNRYVVDTKTTGMAAPINCKTCHSAIHTDYEWTLTTVAPVPMVMWNGTKNIEFTGNAASSNLCAKCHQPRPITGNAGVIDYNVLVSNPTATYNQSAISYRTGIHYGSQAALYKGVGGVEFGSDYTNSWHVTRVSCARCHMADTESPAEGHTFTATIKGCTVSCHSNDESALSARLATQKAELDKLIDDLAKKINAIGVGNDILKKESDGKYHGYFNIYDASSNPTGYWRTSGSPAFPALTNAQFGAIINFQLIVRGAGGGAHNYPYVKKLLENSIAVI